MGALDGVRVIDFGQWIAGPLSAMLLADQGAAVIYCRSTRPAGRDGRRRSTTFNGDAITTIGPPFRLSRTPVVPGALVAPPGADAADVLASLGIADRLDDLVAKRAIALE